MKVDVLLFGCLSVVKPLVHGIIRGLHIPINENSLDRLEKDIPRRVHFGREGATATQYSLS